MRTTHVLGSMVRGWDLRRNLPPKVPPTVAMGGSVYFYYRLTIYRDS